MPKVEEKSDDNTSPEYLVPAKIKRYHRALKLTREARRGETAFRDGLIYVSHVKGCAIIASPKIWDRAVRIAHAVLVALEHRGHRTLSASEMEPGEVVEVRGHRVAFDVRECLRQDRTPDPDHRWRKMRLRPKGLLSVRLFMHRYGGYASNTIADGKNWKLEDRIEDITERFEFMADRQEEHRLWRVEMDRRWEREERRRAKRQAVVERRKLLVDVISQVTDAVELVARAKRAAEALNESLPDSQSASDVATWLRRSSSRIASPRRIRRMITDEAWKAVGMGLPGGQPDS